MIDLFVLAADADMQTVFRAILDRPNALGIRPIRSEFDRHPNRDSGVFRNGPELIRAKPKSEYRYFIIAFDHHGSGCSRPSEECARIVQDRLDSFTFKDCSTVVAIAPELEEWLWHDPSAIADDAGAAPNPDPKERLRQVFVNGWKRGPRIEDFKRIASRANLEAWESSPSFRIFKATLQNWFPRS
jgi:hypothetical protein